MIAGTTVALTLIPQALSYATLANMPPINGLYSAILPNAFYVIFGSSLQLAMGPVAIVSLLMGRLITQYGAEPFSEDAVKTASQASFCVGMILTFLALFNAGVFIRFISHPVMSGFTTAAAMLIGVSQLKSAFGFTVAVPQIGVEKGDGHTYHYNYEIFEWYANNFYGTDSNGRSYRNPFAEQICFGFFVPCMFIQLIKVNWKPRPETKDGTPYKVFIFLCNMLPLMAIIIGANIAWRIKSHTQETETLQFYADELKIVGKMPVGVDILRAPTFEHPFGEFFAAVIPMALISFMESYSVARRLAADRNMLHLLDENQELFANGMGNVLGCISSAYPVSGSFSRSALNGASGAKTPFSKMTTLFITILALQVLTPYFYFIPSAALAAVIWVALYNLMSFTEFWEAWIHSKKDFWIMIVTWLITFIVETSYGLGIGLFFSVMMYLRDVAFSDLSSPFIETPPQIYCPHGDDNSVKIVKLMSDLNFITAPKIKEYMGNVCMKAVNSHTIDSGNEYKFLAITKFLDERLRPRVRLDIDQPRVIIINFSQVKIIDITGMTLLLEALKEGRKAGVLFAFDGVLQEFQKRFRRFGIRSDLELEEIRDRVVQLIMEEEGESASANDA